VRLGLMSPFPFYIMQVKCDDADFVGDRFFISPNLLANPESTLVDRSIKPCHYFRLIATTSHLILITRYTDRKSCTY
jgi:hypothetical protein